MSLARVRIVAGLGALCVVTVVASCSTSVSSGQHASRSTSNSSSSGQHASRSTSNSSSSGQHASRSTSNSPWSGQHASRSTSNSSSSGQHASRSTTTAPSTSAIATEAQPGVHNAADVTFARNMLAHNEQAIELSATVAGNTNNQQLSTLAQKVTAEQQPEVQAFTAWLLQWGQEPNAAQTMPAGAVDQATIDKLQTLNGADFDKLWLQSMVFEHQGVIELALAEIAQGQNSDTIAMAKSIITTQQAEIDQMRQMTGD